MLFHLTIYSRVDVNSRPRIEPVYDRKSRKLDVKGVWWEPGVKALDLAEPLDELERWLVMQQQAATPIP